jgi:putative lipoic acid-binding regulatory protein
VSDAIELEQFPCIYTFKIFGRHTEAFPERVREIVAATLGPVPLDSMKVRQSARGRYLSVTIVIRVHNRAQLEQVYSDLRAEEEVLLYI